MAREDSFPEQFEETHEQAPNLKTRGSLVFWIVSLSAACFIAISVWLNTVEIPDLRDEISYQRDTIFSLTEEIYRLQEGLSTGQEQVSRLEAQLRPFRFLALQKYGPDERKALSQLAQDVKRLPGLGDRG